MQTALRRAVALLLVLFLSLSCTACFGTPPVTPSEPSTPSAPSNPSGPSTPSNPSNPSDPSDPSEPVAGYNTPAFHDYSWYWDPVFGVLSGFCEIQRNADGNILSVTKLIVPIADMDTSLQYWDFTAMLLNSGLFYRYDENGRLASIQYTAAAVGSLSAAGLDVIDLSVSYDGRGYPVSAIAENGNIYCSFVCNDNGRIIKEIWENPGYVSVMEYDETGFLTAVSMRADDTSMQMSHTNVSENVITTEFSAYDNFAGEVYEGRSQYTITVNDEKNLAKIDAYNLRDDDGDGYLEEIHAEFAYNTQGLCTSVTTASLDGTETLGTANVTMEYSETGEIMTITTAYITDTTITEQAIFSYDAAGLKSITVQRDSADAYEASFVRGEAGQIVLTEKSVSGGYTQHKEWVYTAQNGMFSPTSSTVTYYDQNESIQAKYVYTYTDSKWVQSAYIYSDGHVHEEQHFEWSATVENGRVSSSVQATLDANGNCVSRDEIVYTRNAQGRVISAVTTRYDAHNTAGEIIETISNTYNANGHLVERIEEHTESYRYVTTVTYGANGEPLSYDTTRYDYEDNGWVEDTDF